MMRISQTFCRVIVSSFVLLFISIPSRAQQAPVVQYHPEAEELFQRGVKNYNLGLFRQAGQNFAELTGSALKGALPGAKSSDAVKWHQRSSAALYMSASASYQLGRYTDASNDIQKLLDNFPKSKYVEFCHALLGAIQFKQANYEDALREFLWVVDHGVKPELVSRQAQFARVLASDYLTTEQLQVLQRSLQSDRGQALLAMQITRNLLASGDRDAAERTAEAFKKAYPRSKVNDELSALFATNIERPNAPLRVGIILPLSGDFAQEGKSVYDGIKYAFESFRREKSNAPVELIVKDSGSNMLHALQEAQELLQDQSLVALMGELETDISGGIAALAQTAGAPIIIPTPTVNDLTQLGENVFQATADLESKGAFLAQHAIEKMGKKTFVTIAPQNEYGRQMVDGFTAEVDRLGGQILAQKWYYDKPDDLSRHFKSIREIAFRRALQDTLVAKGKILSEINLNAEWRAFEERFKEERYKNFDERQRRTKEGIIDANDVPVTNIDAIFLPVYGDEVGTIARQVSYFNIRAQILGGEHWYVEDLEKSRELQRYVEGAIFPSDYFVNQFDAQYRNLRSDFRLRTGRTAEMWEIFGIDAARLVLSAISSGARTRSQMRQALASTQNFSALRGEIEFTPNRRMNQYINLVQIRQNRFEKVQ
jgi:ABC-type branched-subunit amino acid transport system substrate-binding protein